MTKHFGVRTFLEVPEKHMNKRRSLSELDDVVDEILARTEPEWFNKIDKIIKESLNG